eukprot:g7968.t1
MIGIRLAAAFALPRLTASGVGAVQLGTPGTRPETAERPSTFAGQADSGGQTTAERNAEEADNERQCARAETIAESSSEVIKNKLPAVELVDREETHSDRLTRLLLNAEAQRKMNAEVESVDAAVESAGKAVRKFLLLRSGKGRKKMKNLSGDDDLPPPPSLTDDLNNRPLFAEIANRAEEDAEEFRDSDYPGRLQAFGPFVTMIMSAAELETSAGQPDSAIAMASLRRLRAFLKAVVALDFVVSAQKFPGGGYWQGPAMAAGSSSSRGLLERDEPVSEKVLTRRVKAELIGALALADVQLTLNPDCLLRVNVELRKSFSRSTDIHLWATNFRHRYFAAALSWSSNLYFPGFGTNDSMVSGGRGAVPDKSEVENYLDLFLCKSGERSSRKTDWQGYIDGEAERKRAEFLFISKWWGEDHGFDAEVPVPGPPDNGRWQYLSFRDNYAADRGAGSVVSRGRAAKSDFRSRAMELEEDEQDEVEEPDEEKDFEEPRCAHCLGRALGERIKLISTANQVDHHDQLDEGRRGRYSPCSCGFKGLLGPGENLDSLTVRHVARRVRQHHAGEEEDEELVAKAVFIFSQLRVESWAARLKRDGNLFSDFLFPSPGERARATLDVQKELVTLLKAYPPPAQERPGRARDERTQMQFVVVRGLIYLDRVLNARRERGRGADYYGEKDDDFPGLPEYPAWCATYTTCDEEAGPDGGDADQGQLPGGDRPDVDEEIVETTADPHQDHWPDRAAQNGDDDLDYDGHSGTDSMSEDMSDLTSAAGADEHHAHLFEELVESWREQFHWGQRNGNMRTDLTRTLARSQELERHLAAGSALGAVLVQEAEMLTDPPQGIIEGAEADHGPVDYRLHPRPTSDTNYAAHLLLDVEGDLLNGSAKNDLSSIGICLKADLSELGRPSARSRLDLERRLEESGVVLYPEIEVALLAISLAYGYAAVLDESDEDDEASESKSTELGAKDGELQKLEAQSQSHPTSSTTNTSTTLFWEMLFGFTAEEFGEAQRWLVGQMNQGYPSESSSGSLPLEIPENEFAAYEALLRDNLFPRLGEGTHILTKKRIVF